MARNSEMKSPPRARLGFRVGVTGHRPSGLENADERVLRACVAEVLGIVRGVTDEIKASRDSLYAPDAGTVLRIISPLAEGADVLVADEGLREGYDLQCPLPFERTEYEKDFGSAESLSKFRQMLERASAVLELDGTRSTAELENESYESVGRMVLMQSDILIAVWDGKNAKGKGGTGQIVEEALLQEIPVVWINSSPPHETKVLIGEEYGIYDEERIERLGDVLRRLLHYEPSEKHDLAKVYFSERQPLWTWGFIFEAFCDVFAGEKIRTKGIRVRDFQEETGEEWDGVWNACPGLPEHVKKQIDARFRVHYGWADKLATYYANVYRSSFVANYLMAGLAVFFALLTPAVPRYETFWIICEIVLIVLILSITGVGNWKRWHERWIDYRLLSEQLRQLRFLVPLGLTTPAFRVPAHDQYGDPRGSWVNRHFRAIVREAGMADVRIDGGYLKAYRDFLSEQEIKGQVSYHKYNAPRFHKIHERLHLIGSALFVLTLVAGFAHLYVHSQWLTLCAAVFPAFGAALYGIRTQGEFEQVAKRADAMSVQLESMRSELTHPGHEPSYRLLAYVAEKTAGIMSSETLDWRIVFQSKRLVLPG